MFKVNQIIVTKATYSEQKYFGNEKGTGYSSGDLKVKYEEHVLICSTESVVLTHITSFPRQINKHFYKITYQRLVRMRKIELF